MIMIAVYEFGPDGATFFLPVTISVRYDPGAIPPGVAEEDLILAFYDVANGTWVELKFIVVDTVNHIISAKASHFTQFAVLAKVERDVTPPVISVVWTADTGRHETKVRWITDEPATSQVEYGTTVEYGFTTMLDETLVTSHEVRLYDLDSDTAYHYRVKSQDAAGLLTISGDRRLTTEAKGLSLWVMSIPILVAVFAIPLLVYYLVIRRRQARIEF